MRPLDNNFHYYTLIIIEDLFNIFRNDIVNLYSIKYIS